MTCRAELLTVFLDLGHVLGMSASRKVLRVDAVSSATASVHHFPTNRNRAVRLLVGHYVSHPKPIAPPDSGVAVAVPCRQGVDVTTVGIHRIEHPLNRLSHTTLSVRL